MHYGCILQTKCDKIWDPFDFSMHQDPLSLYISKHSRSSCCKWGKKERQLSGGRCVNHSGKEETGGAEGEEGVHKMKNRSGPGKKQ